MKLLHPDTADDPHGLAHLQNEAAVAARVTHQHLIPLLSAQFETPPF